MSNDDPVCVRCNRPVHANRAQHEVFQRMHYVCFTMSSSTTRLTRMKNATPEAAHRRIWTRRHGSSANRSDCLI